MVHETKQPAYDWCQQHMDQHVLLETTTGDQIEGYVCGLDDEHVHLVVPSQHVPQFPVRPYGYGPHSYGGYGPQGYGYPPFQYGLSRLIIPLTFVAALSLLPW
ncbi:hypothetical protein ABID56_001478 [Alkalibacillus flavidus]|uniref:Uncharacterized protein n=1 Tax=Alkalibacillus flavidus TaxID=546021 RepID=A0ABV2KUY2_9BACI